MAKLVVCEPFDAPARLREHEATHVLVAVHARQSVRPNGETVDLRELYFELKPDRAPTFIGA